jgi:hypothetical protein
MKCLKLGIINIFWYIKAKKGRSRALSFNEILDSLPDNKPDEIKKAVTELVKMGRLKLSYNGKKYKKIDILTMRSANES